MRKRSTDFAFTARLHNHSHHESTQVQPPQKDHGSASHKKPQRLTSRKKSTNQRNQTAESTTQQQLPIEAYTTTTVPRSAKRALGNRSHRFDGPPYDTDEAIERQDNGLDFVAYLSPPKQPPPKQPPSDIETFVGMLGIPDHRAEVTALFSTIMIPNWSTLMFAVDTFEPVRAAQSIIYVMKGKLHLLSTEGLVQFLCIIPALRDFIRRANLPIGTPQQAMAITLLKLRDVGMNTTAMGYFMNAHRIPIEEDLQKDSACAAALGIAHADTSSVQSHGSRQSTNSNDGTNTIRSSKSTLSRGSTFSRRAPLFRTNLTTFDDGSIRGGRGSSRKSHHSGSMKSRRSSRESPMPTTEITKREEKRNEPSSPRHHPASVVSPAPTPPPVEAPARTAIPALAPTTPIHTTNYMLL